MSGSTESAGARRGPVVSIFLNQPVFYDGSIYTSPFPQPADLWIGLARHVGELRLCVPLKRTTAERGNAELELADGVTVVPLPFYWGEMELMRKLPYFALATRRAAIREARVADIVGYVAPSIAGLQFSRAARKKPQFELIRGVKTESVRRIYERGPSRWLFGGGAALIERLASRHRRFYRPVTFVYGRSLLDEMKDGHSRDVIEISDGVPEWMSGGSEPSNARSAPAGLVRFVYVGRLSREKGVDVLLEAIAGLPAERRGGLAVDIVGQGPAEAELRRIAAAREIAGNVNFVGSVAPGPALLELYDRADVFVLPSRTEGVPRVLLEAMSRGLPVVATRVGGVPYLVEDGLSGIIVEPDDSAGLAAAIERISLDGELRVRLGGHGSEVAGQHTLERHRESILRGLSEAYPEVMNRSS